ncbi:SDR family NAD(P)-dependent oxidoreductase [Thaumasiovibrio subtropicus]|uniref:SDR family NAD(P)-dependent oxidoreductase n=1 Tax=Thaumasiovibrio subtropicus TaxID=1891207 RepID=UPI000B35C8CE|nr:SDR family NAD(P)-dependent oxidoreductase [Thaumasiovibrio subtropicus]
MSSIQTQSFEPSDMTGKTVLITGATDGIGRITATKLAELGATVLLHGRNPAKIDAAIQEIKATTGNEHIIGYQADFADLNQVKQLATAVQNDYSRVDVLINNAGLGPGDEQSQLTTNKSIHGYEMIFQVNYLAIAMLTLALLPAIKRAHGRIVNVASAAQAPLDFDNLMLQGGFPAYAHSKLAVIMFSFALSKQLEDEQVNINALDPGSYLNTNIVKETYGGSSRSPEIGALAQLQLATGKNTADITGRYYSEMNEARAHAQAYDSAAQTQLLAKTEQWLSAL